MFVHLHNHSEYSLLDGAIKPKNLVAQAVEYGMPAVALTDHGTMSGIVPFYQSAEKAGVKPLVGCEIYLEPDFVDDKKSRSSHHMTLLAASDQGYRNLIKLVSSAYLDHFYYKPRVQPDALFANSEGIICLSGCIKGEINSFFLKDDYSGARKKAVHYKDVFGDRFFMEIHDHGIESELKVRPYLIKLAKELDIPLVAANDVHYLRKTDHAAHDVLICISTNTRIADENRMHYSSELYFKSEEEMLYTFRDIPEAVHNTMLVSDMCDFKMEFSHPYPVFVTPNGKPRAEYLRDLCWKGLTERYGDRAERDQELRKRLEYELSVIEKTGFVSYFLIVWDFIHYAKTHGIPVGAGRGSAAGSLIAYCLQITDIDPIRFGLLFERFLNPDRISPPDIDIDFCMDRRGEVIEYVRKKYGDRCVSQIITFNTLGAKSAIRDVGRVMGIDYVEVDKLAKLVPLEIGITLEVAEKVGEIGEILEGNAHLLELWEHAKSLEGLNRNAGVHAAGIVITDRPLDEYIPLCKGKDKEVISQYSMGPLGDLGLLKMDFLGLRTLTVIDCASKLIPGFDIRSIPTDDKKTFDIYNRGETLGIFQMESGGITNCCKKFGVSCIDDVMAIAALYRPGPMQFLEDYIARKRGLRDIQYAHPLLESVCADTYGIMVYQEQVQRAANVLAGYSLGEADLLRRAMGKKDKEKMDMERGRFVSGCKRVNNISEMRANEIFDFISAFAQYGFNKSHSAAYGWISYQTAYLKAHHPVEFMAAMLTHDAQDIERMSQVVNECRRMGIRVFPPNVNASNMHFTPTADGILYGLLSVKNIGDVPAASILNARAVGPFKSLEDLCGRVDMRKVTKKTLEALVKAGACDCFGRHRAQLVQDMASSMSSARSVQKDIKAGQTMLFENMVLESRPIEDTPPWPRHEMLGYEREVLGYYVSGHPLENYAGHFDNPKVTTIAKAQQIESGETYERLVGIVVSVVKKFAKKDGTLFAIVTLEDFTGQVEMLAWNDTYKDNKALFKEGNVIVVGVKVKKSEDGVRVLVSQVAPLRQKTTSKPVRLRLKKETLSTSKMESVMDCIRRFSGPRQVIIDIVSPSGASFEMPCSVGTSDESGLRAAVAQVVARA